MMKSKDCAVATALVIGGFLRSNGAEEDENAVLRDCLRAIRQECDDWAENLAPDKPDQAVEPEGIASVEVRDSNGADIARSPYNLGSAVLVLASEMVDLSGPSILDLLIERLRLLGRHIASAGPARPALAPEMKVLVSAANQLAVEIDTAKERPVAKLALFDVACAQLRAAGVPVEEVVTAPSQW